MATVDELLSAFPASTPASAPSQSKANDLLAAFNAPTTQAPEPEGFWSTIGRQAHNAVQAIGTGYNRGLVRLAGLPVDTVANVVDLGKAAIGAPYIALTGKDVPDWLNPLDRAKYNGTSDNMLARIDASKAAPAFNAENPDYQGGYLQNGGAALAGAFTPAKSYGQIARNVAVTQAGAATGKAAYDLTGDPSAAALGSILPAAAVQAGIAGTKYIVRGDEQGRKNTVQRVQDLANAGITQPSVGLATGNKVIGGTENLLASTPGAMGVMANARNRALTGLQSTVTNAADLAAPESLRGARATGIGINKGIQQFNTDFKTQQGALYDNLDKFVPGSTPVDVSNTGNALDSLTATIPGAANTSKAFINGKISGIKSGFDADTGRLDTSGPFSGIGVPSDPTPALPFQAVKQLRTSVGSELSDNTLVPTVPNRQWKQLYGALSGDIGNAADAAGPQATSAFNRANDYTRAGLSRLETVQGFTSDPTSPEQSYAATKSTLGDNASLFNTLKKSLPGGVRGQIAGTVIDQLGTSTPGQQNEGGTAWSPDRFLTNWNRMSVDAKYGLLSGFPNADKVASDVNSVAKATSMMRDNSSLWANPSGTAAAAAARGVLTTPVIALATGHPLVAGGAVGLLGASNLAARGLTSKWAVDALQNKTDFTPDQLRAALQQMAAQGLLKPEDQPAQ